MDEQVVLTKINEKLSVPIENLKQELNELDTKTRETFSGLSDDEYRKRALQSLTLRYKAFLKSPTVGFEGIIIGAGDVIDMVARKRSQALREYDSDPQSAVMKGLVNEQGEPLDTIQTFRTGRANPNYGQPLPENSYQRTIFGVATKSNKEDDKPKVFVMNIRGDMANDIDIPMFEPVNFSAIDRTPDELKDEKYILNASRMTRFVKNANLNFPPIKDILNKVCQDYIADFKDLEEYHKRNEDDYNRFVLISGGVSSLNLEGTEYGSRIMNLEDVENLEDFDMDGVTCWIPQHVKIDFAEGSKVVVIGKTNQRTKRDENGNEEKGDVSINVYGIYAVPEYKIELPEDVEEINEENDSTEEQKTINEFDKPKENDS